MGNHWILSRSNINVYLIKSLRSHIFFHRAKGGKGVIGTHQISQRRRKHNPKKKKRKKSEAYLQPITVSAERESVLLMKNLFLPEKTLSRKSRPQLPRTRITEYQ